MESMKGVNTRGQPTRTNILLKENRELFTQIMFLISP